MKLKRIIFILLSVILPISLAAIYPNILRITTLHASQTASYAPLYTFYVFSGIILGAIFSGFIILYIKNLIIKDYKLLITTLAISIGACIVTGLLFLIYFSPFFMGILGNLNILYTLNYLTSISIPLLIMVSMLYIALISYCIYKKNHNID